jgi:hypothetical protein
MNDQIIVVEAEEVKLGSLTVAGPEAVLEQASRIATALARVINDRRLFTDIRGKKYVRVEGWSTLGALLGILPREVSAVPLDDGSYEAVVELVRASDGVVIGRGSAICGMDEPTWAGRDAYARRSMAITRATGKAFRLGFSWIMTLAGYEPTPWEEMPADQGTQSQFTTTTAGAKQAPKKENGNGHSHSVPQALVNAGAAATVGEAAELLNQMPAHVRGDAVLAVNWARENKRVEAQYTELEDSLPQPDPEDDKPLPKLPVHPKEITATAFWKAIDELASVHGYTTEDLRKQTNQVLVDNGGSRVDALDTMRKKVGGGS